DGIRDATVTGVQTCALPIYPPSSRMNPRLTAVIAFALAWPVASPAGAQADRWERQVHQQLERAVTSLGAKRAVRSLVTRIGTLDTDEPASFPVPLQAGRSDLFVGRGAR